MNAVADNLDEFANDPEMVAMFVNNATELAGQIEADLVTIEKLPTDSRFDVVNRIFRAAHTIKGESGFVGLSNIGRLAHSMENILDKVRDTKIEPTHRVVSTLLDSLDTLRDMIDHVQDSHSVNLDQHIADLAELDCSTATELEVPVVATTVEVPAAPVAPTPEATRATQAPIAVATPSTPKAAPSTRVRVLIVDDEPMVIRIAARAFAKAGMQADSAGTAEEALLMMRRSLYNVVICDLGLPGMSGVELLPKLKSVSPMVQVVMLTGNANLVTVLECLEAGATDFLPKTQDYTQLVAITSAALERVDRWIPLMKSRR